MERRLAAILAADVVGYSRLMGEDEPGTLAALKAHRSELIDPKVAEHGGRIVKLMGDGILIEFPSVVEAVQCAVEVQQEMSIRNADVPEDRRILFRVGINLGDVIIDGDDIYGDGVNVAARLESLAEPGGICVRRTVRNQVRDKLPYGFEDMGEVEVKNIARPVRAFHVRAEPGAISATKKRWHRTWLWSAITAVAVVVAAALGAIAWWQPWTGEREGIPIERPADLPAIAVLPFDNMSGDPAQDYFSDGITEDLINDLSRVAGLLVIARNTVFTYKGAAVNVRDVGRELGVQYVVEGSVRKAGDRIRINAQLIDTENEHHLWADRYDRELTDVFALQDDVVQKIVSALKVELTADEEQQLSQAPKADPEVYDLMLRGRELVARFTRQGNEEAREMFESVIALEPGNARAHARLAFTHLQDVARAWATSTEASIGRALDASRVALALDETLPLAHFVLANTRIGQGKHDEAITATRRAIELDPSYADGYAAMALHLTWAGRPGEALPLIEKALRLNPRHPFFYSYILGHRHFVAGRYEDAASNLEAVLERNPEFLQGHVYLAASYAYLDRLADAQWEIEEIRTLNPDFSIDRTRPTAFYKHQADLDRLIDGLRKAGLPE